MSMSVGDRVCPRAWSCPRISPDRFAIPGVTGRISVWVARNSSNQSRMRGFGFQASPKQISSTVTALIVTLLTPCAHSRTPVSGLFLTSSLKTLVSTRKLVEGIGEGVGPLLPGRNLQGVVLFVRDA